MSADAIEGDESANEPLPRYRRRGFLSVGATGAGAVAAGRVVA